VSGRPREKRSHAGSRKAEAGPLRAARGEASADFVLGLHQLTEAFHGAKRQILGELDHVAILGGVTCRIAALPRLPFSRQGFLGKREALDRALCRSLLNPRVPGRARPTVAERFVPCGNPPN
jgi:hypothetical protein